MNRQESYFKSKYFRGFFFSYLILILVFVAGMGAWYLYAYRASYQAGVRESARQKASAFATESDRDLLTAQALCSAMNTSESLRNIYQVTAIEKKTVDSMQLYRALSELSRVKGASGNLDVYSILLYFQGDTRLYAPGTVIALDSAVSAPFAGPWIGQTSVAELLRLQGSTNVILNKQFLIYADVYNGGTGASAKGVALVLLDTSGLAGRMRALQPLLDGAEILDGSRAVYASGDMRQDGEVYEIGSLVAPGVVYRLQLAEAALRTPVPFSVLLPLGLMILGGAAFLYVLYRSLKRRYRPIGEISQMVSTDKDGEKPRDEMEDIMRGIADLIGERNGYREKMITISPYASHGALHQLLSGTIGGQQMEVLREEQFWGLRQGYFVVGVVNLAAVNAAGAPEQRFLDARALAAHACAAFSDEEHTVVTCPRDAQNLYVVVNGDHGEALGELFYDMLPKMVEAIDDSSLAVTVGVSAAQTDPEHLRDACREAARALENMLTGGRGSVYFIDAERDEEGRSYELPKDFQKRVVRDLKENNQEDLNALLDALWEKNIRRAALPPETVRQMVNELHACIGAALREISEKSTTHIRIERIREPATIEEIFAYYRTLLSRAAQAYQEEVAGDSGEALQQDICDYINQNLYNPELSLSSVADHFGVSGKLVGAVCKNAFGKTYLQYVRDCQIQHAVQLLQTTELPLEEIAEQCGFSNLLTFRRNFKAAMNMNPSDFRKE